jgi:branched-chain amino acid transport system ATP-binding protein
MAESATIAESILDIRDLTILFGGLRAVGDFTMSVPFGGLYGLIGPNGAGKTTVFNLITGVYHPTAGDILYQGTSLVGVPTHRITQRGVARTFQNIRLFQNLTVLDNVRIALNTSAGYGLLEGVSRLGRFGRAERHLTERAQELLGVLGLENRQLETARNLPYGEQRRLEIARALATEPQLLLLDEPAAGMNPTESESLMELIQFVRESFHLSILLIEHQMRVVMGICEWITVMDFGQVIARGTARDIQNDQRVIEAYLGKRSGKELGVYAPSS